MSRDDSPADDYLPHRIEWTPERITRLWDYYGNKPGGETLYFSAHSGHSVLAFLRRHVRLRGREVLDFGCGRGDMLRHLLDIGVACRGLEFSERSADEAESRLRGVPLFGGVVRAKGLPTSLGDASVDIVMLVEVLEHLLVEQVRPTLGEIRRVLRPGGYVVVTTPHDEDLEAGMMHCPECGSTFHQWQHLRSVSPENLLQLMGDAGFEPVVCVPLFFRPRFGATSLLMDGARLLERLRGRKPKLPHLAYVGRVGDVASR